MLTALMLYASVSAKLTTGIVESALFLPEAAGVTAEHVEIFPEGMAVSIRAYRTDKAWQSRLPDFRATFVPDDVAKKARGQLQSLEHRGILAAYRYMAEQKMTFEDGLISHFYRRTENEVVLYGWPQGRSIFTVTLDNGLIAKRHRVRRFHSSGINDSKGDVELQVKRVAGESYFGVSVRNRLREPIAILKYPWAWELRMIGDHGAVLSSLSEYLKGGVHQGTEYFAPHIPPQMPYDWIVLKPDEELTFYLSAFKVSGPIRDFTDMRIVELIFKEESYKSEGPPEWITKLGIKLAKVEPVMIPFPPVP